MYGASTSGRGAHPAAGTSGGSLADDGPVGVDGRRNGFAARGGAAGAFSAAPTGHGGHGDGSIFSTSSGLYEVAKSRTGSSYAESAHGGSQSGRKQERRSDAADADARGDPKQWVRVDDLMRTSLKAETALGRIAEATSAAAQRESPRKQGGIRRVETATQTDVAGLVEPANPRAQLSFQASLQTELRETQELLIETQMRVKELASDKKRLVEDLEEATRARVGARKGGETLAAAEKDHDDVPDDAMTPTQEEMDETVHSLLEMITAERDRAGALETHLARLTTELDLEREARLSAQNVLAVRERETDEDFSAQERKLREATEIIAELRGALLSVMQTREGSVFGGSALEGGSHGGPSSDGGSSRRSAGGRSQRGAREDGARRGATSIGAIDVAATEAEATPNRNESDADIRLPPFLDLDVHDAMRGARVALRRVTSTPGFELAWPLLLVAFLLRAQIGPDTFTWRSLTR